MNGKPLTDYHNFTTANITRVDPRTSEDCLFLDVLASKAVYENKNNGSGAAVLVWIHGGGYAAGWKTLFGTGRGLITRSEGNRDGGIVYVSINYRLGLFVSFATTHGFSHQLMLDAGMACDRFKRFRPGIKCWPARPTLCLGMDSKTYPPFWRGPKASNCYGRVCRWRVGPASSNRLWSWKSTVQQSYCAEPVRAISLTCGTEERVSAGSGNCKGK